MKFKHTFHVFVDNFPVVYKQLLYRLIVMLISTCICVAAVYPFVREILDSSQFTKLADGLKGFITNLLDGNVNELRGFSETVKKGYAEVLELLNSKLSRVILSVLLLALVHIVAKWFEGLGNYATACVINDKMAFRAEKHFFATLIDNLKNAAAYNAIYVPLSILYDWAIAIGMFFLFFFLLNSVLYTFICIFLFVLVLVVAIVFKMAFTTDWLPALIRGKMRQGEAMKYTFSQKGKSTLNVASNFSVLTLLIFGVNVAAAICTLGVGLLLTIPSSYVVLICFEFVNYYDREGHKYFIDKNTIVGGAKDRPKTREEFFRGEE